MSHPDRYHVTPQWEEHEPVADCWCEPSIIEEGRVVVHHAKTCKDGGTHRWQEYPNECAVCGQQRPSVFERSDSRPPTP